VQPQLSPVSYATPPRDVSHFRWVILALLFLGTTFNYIDRIVISVLSTDLQQKFSISDDAYGYIGSAFALAYAVGQIFAGRLLDRVGTRLTYGLALITWSACAMLTALGSGAVSFALFRAALGFCESPSFPAAAKVCAEWFPRRQRAFAFGWVNAGANTAAISTPLIVPWLTVTFNWQAAFVYTGALGLALAAVWFLVYRRPQEHPRVSPAELALIESDPPEPAVKIPWAVLVRHRQTWVFAAGKFLSDGIWWFFITWIPKFFRGDPYHLDLTRIGPPLVVIYLMADAGSVGGGLLSSFLLRRGASVNFARKFTMLLFGCLALPIVFAPAARDLWTAVLLVGLATAGHQGFSSNIYTLCSDLFPKNAVASVAGLGGFCGYLGAALFQAFTGKWVQYTHNYYAPFLCAGLAYLVAVGVMHALSPNLRPADLTPAADPLEVTHESPSAR
jgi:ACS family hexuronate transporter-like MFS transporter